MMEQFYRVPLRQLVEEFNLKVIYQAPDYDQIQITAVDINRAAGHRSCGEHLSAGDDTRAASDCL